MSSSENVDREESLENVEREKESSEEESFELNSSSNTLVNMLTKIRELLSEVDDKIKEELRQCFEENDRDRILNIFLDLHNTSVVTEEDFPSLLIWGLKESEDSILEVPFRTSIMSDSIPLTMYAYYAIEKCIGRKDYFQRLLDEQIFKCEIPTMEKIDYIHSMIESLDVPGISQEEEDLRNDLIMVVMQQLPDI